MKHAALAAILTALLLSACGRAVPTVDPALVQASAAAAAGTIIALTQQARPTKTLIPPPPSPSPTEAPSPTPFLLDTPAPADTPTTSSGTDNCNHLLDASAGPNTRVLIRNETDGKVTFSMGLSAKNSYGQCGYMGWSNIQRQGTLLVGPVPLVRTNQGDPCYWAAAWINDPKRQTHVSYPGAACINNTDKWTFIVRYDTIRLIAP
jgi:hypothetical protein